VVDEEQSRILDKETKEDNRDWGKRLMKVCTTKGGRLTREKLSDVKGLTSVKGKEPDSPTGRKRYKKDKKWKGKDRETTRKARKKGVGKFWY